MNAIKKKNIDKFKILKYRMWLIVNSCIKVIELILEWKDFFVAVFYFSKLWRNLHSPAFLQAAENAVEAGAAQPSSWSTWAPLFSHPPSPASPLGDLQISEGWTLIKIRRQDLKMGPLSHTNLGGQWYHLPINECISSRYL